MAELEPPDFNYLAFSHEELAVNIEGLDPSAAGEYAAVWTEIGQALSEFGQDLRRDLNTEAEGWTGRSAEAVFDFTAKMAAFTETTGEGHDREAVASDWSAETGSWAKHAMPPPTGFDRATAMNSAAMQIAHGDFVNGIAAMEAMDAQQAAAEEAHREAARVSTERAKSMHDAHSQSVEFADPPSLSDSMASVNEGSGPGIGSGLAGAIPDLGSTTAAGAPSASSASVPQAHVPSVPVSGNPVPAPGRTTGGVDVPPRGTPPPSVSPPHGGNPVRPGPGVLPVGTPPGGRASDSPRSNRSPFPGMNQRQDAPTGRAAGGTSAGRPPGGGNAGSRVTSGTPGQQPGAGNTTGGAPQRGPVPMGGRVAAQAAAGRGGMAPGMMGGAGGRGQGDEDKEHQNKYAEPADLGDGIYDEERGYSIDPETGNPIMRPVLGDENEPPAPPSSAAPMPNVRPGRAKSPPQRPTNGQGNGDE